MFIGKKLTRKKLFEKAMLSHKDRVAPRRTARAEMVSFPWASISLWSAFSLVSGYILFFSPALTVREIIVEGESIFPASEYRALAESVVEGSTFGIFQHRNYFFLPTDRIAARLLERYPQLSTVSVRRQFPDGMKLAIAESPSIFLWCSGGPCYGIRDGRAVMMPVAEEGRYDVIRRSILDESALPVDVGEELSIDLYFSALRSVQENFQKLAVGNLSPISRTPSRHSGELVFSTEEGWKLLVSVNRPVDKSLGMLQSFLVEYAKDHPDRSGLASVDLRIEGKVFYAEKDAPLPVEAVAPDETGATEKQTPRKKKSDR